MFSTISSSSLLIGLIDIKQTTDQEFIDQLPHLIQSFAQSLFVVDKAPFIALRKRLISIAVEGSILKGDPKIEVFSAAMRRYRGDAVQLFELAIIQALFDCITKGASSTKVVAVISLNCYHWHLFDQGKLQATEFPTAKEIPEETYENIRPSLAKRGRGNRGSQELKTKKISKHVFESEVRDWARSVLKKASTENQLDNTPQKTITESKALLEIFEQAMDYLQSLLK